MSSLVKQLSSCVNLGNLLFDTCLKIRKGSKLTAVALVSNPVRAMQVGFANVKEFPKIEWLEAAWISSSWPLVCLRRGIEMI